jgi:hypothetical protein
LVSQVEVVERNTMKKLALVVGLISLLLGGLWLLQGLGLAHIRSILCFANCARVQGASTAWAVTGALMLTAAAIAIYFASRGRGQR